MQGVLLNWYQKLRRKSVLSFCEGHRQVKCFSDVYKGSHEYSGLKKTLKCKSPSDKKEGYFLLQYAQGLVHWMFHILCCYLRIRKLFLQRKRSILKRREAHHTPSQVHTPTQISKMSLRSSLAQANFFATFNSVQCVRNQFVTMHK